MLIETLTVGPVMTNCYIIACEDTKEAAVIDPGGDAKRILDTVQRMGVEVVYVLNTHGHFDHTLVNDAVIEVTGAPLAIHEADAPMLTMGGGAAWFGMKGSKSSADVLLHEGDTLKVGNLQLQVLHVPGHSPGGVAFYIASEGVVFSGDALFNMGIGRTDLPGGDYEELITSIQTKLFALPGETVVYSGHGPATTIARERAGNPFLF
jgi:glyoxylase-like metal-dependent hydrolase (beta-lactamase superfamily II)